MPTIYLPLKVQCLHCLVRGLISRKKPDSWAQHILLSQRDTPRVVHSSISEEAFFITGYRCMDGRLHCFRFCCFGRVHVCQLFVAQDFDEPSGTVCTQLSRALQLHQWASWSPGASWRVWRSRHIPGNSGIEFGKIFCLNKLLLPK